MVMQGARFAAMIGLYGATIGVCFGVAMMTPEKCMPGKEAEAKEIWKEGPPPVSAALACTMNLTLQFFAIFLAYNIFQVVYDFLKSKIWFLVVKPKFDLVLGVLKLATQTVKFAPMLCILFIGARMRALQMDPKNGAPQPWAQTLFYVCAYGLLIGTGLVLLNPIFASLTEDEPPQLKLSGPI